VTPYPAASGIVDQYSGCLKQRSRCDGERILIMNVPAKADVDDATRELLAGLAVGDPELLAEGLELRAGWKERSGLNSRTYALVKIAALIALDAPPASYLWQVGNAINEGVLPSDILGVLIAVAPQVGGPKVIAAAPEIMIALGLTLPDGS
jgi:4-carboxymuconolactone decarboxylase